MLDLILKDLTFNRGSALAGLAMAVAASALLAVSSPIGTAMAIVLVPTILFNQTVGKSCYMDDKEGLGLLRSLPISPREIVASKYVGAAGVLFVSAIVLAAVLMTIRAIGPGPGLLTADLALYAASGLLAFFSLYLWLFFQFNFGAAQQSSLLLVGILLVATKLMEMTRGAAILDISHLPALAPGLMALTLAVLFSTAMAAVSTHALKTRGR